MTMENGCFLSKDMISFNVTHDISSVILYGLVDIHALYAISFKMFHDPFFRLYSIIVDKACCLCSKFSFCIMIHLERQSYMNL